MKYATPAAFKAALEDRLRNQCERSQDIGRLRQLVVYDRFLCRVLSAVDLSFVLKGGVVLELRLPFARATKDIDVCASGSPDGLLGALQRAGRSPIDPLRFEVSVDPKHPTIEAEGMVYEGFRFRVQCTLAAKPYGRRFGLDVAFADPMHGCLETLPASDWFSFAGLEGVPIPVVPVETHIAEKLHAYTVPRDRPNSRLKDLPDLALLALIRPIDASVLRAAIERTFSHRGTHVPPSILPPPPDNWAVRYPRFSRGSGLPWATLEEAEQAAADFLNPVLSGNSGLWDPTQARWSVY